MKITNPPPIHNPRIYHHDEDETYSIPLTGLSFLAGAKLPPKSKWLDGDDLEVDSLTGVLLLEMVPHHVFSSKGTKATGSFQIAIEIDTAVPHACTLILEGIIEKTGHFKTYKHTNLRTFDPETNTEIENNHIFYFIANLAYNTCKLSGTLHIQRNHQNTIYVTGTIKIQSETASFSEIPLQNVPLPVIKPSKQSEARALQRQQEDETFKRVMRELAEKEEKLNPTPPLPTLADLSILPAKVKLLFIAPDEDCEEKNNVLTTKKDSWGWLFDYLYLQRNGFNPKVCTATSNIMPVVQEYRPDLIIWFLTSGIYNIAFEFLTELRQSIAFENPPHTFFLPTHHGPYPALWEVANAADFFILDPERFIGIMVDLLNHRGIPNYKSIPPLPFFGGDMREHPDPEISEFFKKLPP